MSTCRNSQQLVGEEAPALWHVVPQALPTVIRVRGFLPCPTFHRRPGLTPLTVEDTDRLVTAGWGPRCVPLPSGQV